MKKAFKSLKELSFENTLSETLKELGITRNALAVEAKVRPATINEIESGEAKQVNFETLESIIEALNRIAEEKGLNVTYNVENVFQHKESADQ
jgi:transcriptional regulator with XRE-family HTH domain|nr:helix-turn-helix transcriptional regulator [Heyndrickxia oleronia]